MRTTLTLALWLVPALAQAAPLLHFEGNEQVPTAELEQALGRLGSFDDETLRLAVMALYYDQGFVDVRVDLPMHAGDTIVIPLHEGARYRLGQVKLAGAWPLGAAVRLECHHGEVVSRARLVADFERLKALGGGTVTVTTNVDRAQHTLDVTFERRE